MKHQYQQGLSHWLRVTLFAFGLILSILLTFSGDIFSKGLAQNPADYPRNQALYLNMRDGVKIAIDVWLPENLSVNAKIPTIMRATRYWRAVDLVNDTLESNPNNNNPLTPQPYSGDIEKFNNSGYAVVLVDARGTGASFGTAPISYSPEEIKDYDEIIDWIASQPWSNQKVGAYGTSYDGNTAELMAANQNPVLKAIVPRFNDFDIYNHLIFPGGIFNQGFVEGWNNGNKIFDTSPCSFEPDAEVCGFFRERGIIGVKPVDEDKDLQLLAQAVQEHAANTDIFEAAQKITYKDDKFADTGLDVGNISPYNFQKNIEDSKVAIYGWGSWLDAGTAQGVLNRFMTFRNPQRVVIGPWTHGAVKNANPYLSSNPDVTPSRKEQLTDIVNFFDIYLKEDRPRHRLRRNLKYYTYVEDKWKNTRVWPPRGTRNQRWFLAANNTLSQKNPRKKTGEDKYTINFEATTGEQSRWGQSTNTIVYPDRVEEDNKLLTYTSEPLQQDIEVTGNPIVTLYASSTTDDGAFYVYLEDVDENGRVNYVTEGQLRSLHRKISRERPPYAVFGPYHSFKQKDGQPLEPGQVNKLTFDLLPISTLIQKGHQIRVAIAGNDKDSFVPIPSEATPEITVERNKVYASHIDLPVMRQ